MNSPVYSTILGNSAWAMEQIARLYIPEDSLVADLTYNKGVFWRKLKHLRVVGSDVAPYPGISVMADLCLTPYRPETFDVVVIDPPYGNMSTAPRKGVAASYNTKRVMTPDVVWGLYSAGLNEAKRILKPEGTAIVKCQAFVNSGKQHWIEEDLLGLARHLGLSPQDRFFMLPPNPPPPDKRTQQHARKWGSTFWVFQKPKAKKARRKTASSVGTI